MVHLASYIFGMGHHFKMVLSPIYIHSTTVLVCLASYNNNFSLGYIHVHGSLLYSHIDTGTYVYKFQSCYYSCPLVCVCVCVCSHQVLSVFENLHQGQILCAEVGQDNMLFTGGESTVSGTLCTPTFRYHTSL